jgi:16S rRNA (cytidine1402-2'-O)-methyltransferase
MTCQGSRRGSALRKRVAGTAGLTRKLRLPFLRSLSELVAGVQRAPVKGELVIVVEGATAVAPDLEGAIAEALERIEEGESTREATRAVATERGVPRRALYDRVVQARDN